MSEDNQQGAAIPEPKRKLGPVTRVLVLGIGWFFVVLGGIGIVLPVLPTTPFLLISLWAFSVSSPRLHHWLYTHPRFGPWLVAWSRYHVIPVKAKILAVTMMTGSWIYITVYVAETWALPIILGLIMTTVFAYILTKPSTVPVGNRENELD
jgi:hypothetical protein